MQPLSFPRLCACCLTPDPTMQYRVKRMEIANGTQRAHVVDVPICRDCKGRVGLRWTILTVAMALFAIAGCAACIIGFGGSTGIELALLWLVLSFVVYVVLWFRVVQFAWLSKDGKSMSFKSPDYQRLFNELNPA